jgi:signal transduction histidine kinase
VEAALLLFATAGLSELAFRTHRPLTYLVFPALIWAALRFGPRGATLAVAVVVGLCVWNTTHFLGPFAVHSASHMVLSTQLFIAAAALSALFMAAVVTERARFAEGLAASRARLIAAGDGERRRLERNLHDGAQQRLLSIGLALQLVRTRLGPDANGATELLAEADQELRAALDELRELAQGIHPAVLTERGLAAALRSLADRASVPVTIAEVPGERLPAATEAAAYFLVSEALANVAKHAHANRVRVSVAHSGGQLLVEVDDDGVGGADPSRGSGMRGLADRVHALDGHLRVDSRPGHGTRVRAAIPCA